MGCETAFLLGLYMLIYWAFATQIRLLVCLVRQIAFRLSTQRALTLEAGNVIVLVRPTCGGSPTVRRFGNFPCSDCWLTCFRPRKSFCSFFLRALDATSRPLRMLPTHSALTNSCVTRRKPSTETRQSEQPTTAATLLAWILTTSYHQLR